MGYRVGSVVCCRPLGMVHRTVPSGRCSAVHPGCCLSRWSCRHFGSPFARTSSSACLVRHAVLEIALRGRPPAAGSGACGVPDLGQVPEPDPGIMPAGLVPVITRISGDRLERDDQVRLSGGSGGQPPGAPSAGWPGPLVRGEGEPRRPGAVRGSGAIGQVVSGWFTPSGLLVAGCRPGAAVPDGVPVAVGHRDAPGGLRVGRGGAG
jgi:hypothetical protein